MKSLIKYSVLCLGALMCATSLTSCPGARATAKALGRTSGTTTRTVSRTGNSYMRTAGDITGAYIDYRRHTDRNNRRNQGNYYGTPYYGNGYGTPYYNSGYGY